MVAAHGDLRHDELLDGVAQRQPDAGEHPGAKHRRPWGCWVFGVGIIEPPAHGDGGRLGVELVAEKVDTALVGIGAPHVVHEADGDDGLAGLRAELAGRLPGMGHHPHERWLIDVEIDEDRVDRHDRGQRGLVLVDEVADLQLRAADLSGDGGGDRAKLDVEPGELFLGAGRGQGAGIFLKLRRVAVELLLARRSFVDEFLVTLDLHGEEPPLAGELLDRARGRGEVGGVGPLVDLVERVALRDELAVAKMDLREIAGDPAADVDHELRIDSPRHLQVVGHPDGLRCGDHHLRDRRGGRRRRWTAAAAG